jgi:hypothetical protein
MVFPKNAELKLRWLEIFSVSLFLLLITYNIFFGQKIAIHNGLGWDGAAVAAIFKNFGYQLKTHSLDFYALQHVFPQMGMYVIFRLFHMPITDNALLTGALITNYIFILVALLFFYFITHKLQPSVRILAFCGTFLNFATLKFSGYYTLLPDVGAFVLSILLLYSYLKEYKILFLLVSLAGSFTFPSFALLGLLLFCFKPKISENNQGGSSHFIYPLLITIIIAFVSLISASHYFLLFNDSYSAAPHYLSIFFNHFHSLTQNGLNIFISKYLDVLHVIYSNSITSINYKFFLLSFILLILYTYFSQRPLLDKISIKEVYQHVKFKRALIYGLVVYGSLFFVEHFLCNRTEFSAAGYFFSISYTAIINPLCFLIMHFVYYGPIILLFILFSKDFFECIKTISPGLVLFTAISLILTIDSESRHLLNIIPILIFFFALAINQNKKITEKLTFPFLIFFVASSLLISCFWIKIRLPAQLPNAVNTQTFQQFPYQSYFMFQGPWTSHSMYYLFLALFLILLTAFYIHFKAPFQKFIK